MWESYVLFYGHKCLHRLTVNHLETIGLLNYVSWCPRHGSSWAQAQWQFSGCRRAPCCPVWSLTLSSCLFLSALPLCPWQGVEKLVHYFSDKAWYGTVLDFSPPTFLVLWFLLHHFAWCMPAPAWDHTHAADDSVPVSLDQWSVFSNSAFVDPADDLASSCVWKHTVAVLHLGTVPASALDTVASF